MAVTKDHGVHISRKEKFYSDLKNNVSSDIATITDQTSEGNRFEEYVVAVI